MVPPAHVKLLERNNFLNFDFISIRNLQRRKQREFHPYFQYILISFVNTQYTFS